MKVPENLKYTEDHEWVRLEGEFAYVGITDFAQSELGDIVYVELGSPGDQFEQGQTFGTVEAVKTVSDLLMPVDGEIVEINADLEEKPELVNESPYDKGWMVKIRIKSIESLDSLLDSQAYSELSTS